MSHRAIVAIQTGSDSYDVHYSANGAQDLYLTELLEEHVANRTKDLDAIASSEGQSIPRVEKWNQLNDLDGDLEIESPNIDEPPLNPQPMVEDISLEEIGLPVDFDNIEAFYLVRHGTVETYVPVWLEPNVIRPWRENLEVQVYKSGKLPDNPMKMYEGLEEQDPLRTIDSETLSPRKNWLNDTIISDVVTQHHESVHAVHRMLVNESRDSEKGPMEVPEDYDAQSILSTQSYTLLIHGPMDTTITPSPTGRGLLIRVPNYNTSKYWRVVEEANEARVEVGAWLNAGEEVTDSDRTDATKDLLIEILRGHYEEVAPFSPPPFGRLAETVANSLGTS